MKLFRNLNDVEKGKFQKWARDNYKPYSEIKGVWHPVVQEECTKMNREAELNLESAL